HRQQAAVNQPDIACRELRSRKCPPGGAKKILDVATGYLQIVSASVVRIVAGPDHRDIPPRYDEEEPAVRLAAAGGCGGLTRNDQVHRSRKRRRGRALFVDRKPCDERRGPRTGGVDDNRGLDGEGFSTAAV